MGSSAEYMKEYNKKYLTEHPGERSKYNQKFKKKHPNYQSDYDKKHREWYEKTPAYRYSVYKSGAKKRKLPFLVTLEQFETFWQKPCTYCGGAIETIGLDRVDNTKGYQLDNVTPCCWICQRAKLDLPLVEFKEWMARLAQFHIKS